MTHVNPSVIVHSSIFSAATRPQQQRYNSQTDRRDKRTQCSSALVLTICRSSPEPLLYVVASVDGHDSEYQGT